MPPDVEEIAAWRIQRENELLATIHRPRTARGSMDSGRMSPAPGSLSSNMRDSQYRGLGTGAGARSATASPGPGLYAPDHSLRAFRSEINLSATLGGARNMSSSSLAIPPRRFDSPSPGPASRPGTGSRPGTAHSMRGLAAPDRPAAASASNLHLNLPNLSTSTLGNASRSPLGRYELDSPVTSEPDSLLGDEPDRIADGIKARLAREEEAAARARAADQERRWAEARANTAAQRQRARQGSAATVGSHTTRLGEGYPSPPASVEGEHETMTLSVPSTSPAAIGSNRPRSPAPSQRPTGPRKGSNDSSVRAPAGHAVAPRARAHANDSDVSSGRGLRHPIPERPLSTRSPLAHEFRMDDASDRERSRERVSSAGSLTPGIQHQLKSGEGSQDATPQSITVPARTTSHHQAAAPRSPFFQEMNPFDIHSEDDDEDDINDRQSQNDGHHQEDDDEKTVVQPTVIDHRAANAPYGLPTPPLSHRARPSEEDEDESLPVLRSFEARRDTMVVGMPGRESLGLQIEEFEKSLQQAQAMSALEMGSDAIAIPIPASNNTTGFFDLQIPTRGRAGSNGSSNYSDMSESPMTIEPPLVSPKPFPLSPRPMSPGDRLRASTSDPEDENVSPCPMFESRPDSSPFGTAARERTAALQGIRRQDSADTEESFSGPWTGAAPLTATGTTSLRPRAPARVRRPGPDEYGVALRPTQTPTRDASPVEIVDSPTLKDLRSLITSASPPDAHSAPPARSYTDTTTSSMAASMTGSPLSSGAGSGSYSVFSPPQHQPQHHQKQRQQYRPQTAPHVTGHRANTLGVQRPAPQPPARSLQAEWQFGPAPSAPPTSPLPIPARSALRRKDTLELRRQKSQQQLPSGKAPQASATGSTTAPSSPGLAAPASIRPDTDANPNWPLPGPGSSSAQLLASHEKDMDHDDTIHATAGASFAARRSLFRVGGRAPPAPLNIAATRFADEISSFGGGSGPWTPDPPASVSAAMPATGAKSAGLVGGSIDSLSGDTSYQQLLADGQDKSAAIGVARGLSIKYDREKGGSAAERARLRTGLAGWRLEEESSNPREWDGVAPIMSPVLSASPTSIMAGEPFDRLIRPNHGLKSPTGIADEQGIRFI